MVGSSVMRNNPVTWRVQKSMLTYLAVVLLGLDETESERVSTGGISYTAPMKEGPDKALFSEMLAPESQEMLNSLSLTWIVCETPGGDIAQDSEGSTDRSG